VKSVEAYAEAYRATVQQSVTDERVLAVAVLSRPGSLGSGLLMQVSDMGGLLRNRAGKSASAGLPQNVIAAVTPTRVMFFDFKPKMTSVVIKRLVREIPRAGLRVTGSAGTLATRVTFDLADGSRFELDSNRSVGQYARLNDAFFTVLQGADVACG
jgi:hypothetical protein